MSITRRKFGSGRQEWKGSRLGTDHCATGTLNPANFTVENGYIPAGTPVDMSTLNDLKPWADAAGAVLGFIETDQHVEPGATEVRPNVQWFGRIILDELPVELTPPTLGDAKQFTLVGGAV